MSTEQHPTIDQKLAISDLMDVDLLRDFMGKFSAFSRLKIRLVDERANSFITQGDAPRFCVLVKGTELCKPLCEEANTECNWMPFGDEVPLIYKTYCGLSYAVAPLAVEFEILGRTIFGPFRETGATISKRTFESGAAKNQLECALEKIPLCAPDEVKRVTNLFADSMDIFLFLSAKRLLTSRLHLETIYRARNDIFKEMENQMSSKEDREEIERLKQIF